MDNAVRMWAIFAVAAVAALPTSAFGAGCFSGAGGADAATLSVFTSTPSSVIDGGIAGLELANRVRALSATATEIVPQMIDVAADPNTSVAQQAGIGAGLGRAANICKTQHPDLADEISRFVAEAFVANPKLAVLNTAYLQALSGQTAVAALGTAGSSTSVASGISNSPSGDVVGGGTGGGTSGATNTDGNLLRLSRSGAGSSFTEINQFTSSSRL